MGRPKYVPTEKDRSTVQTMAGFGIPQDEIARAMKMSGHTIREYFKDELASAATKANAAVARSLYLAATEKNNVTAMIFWLKARAGWREAQGPALLQEKPDGFDLGSLSDNQLLVLERITTRAQISTRPENPAPLARTS